MNKLRKMNSTRVQNDDKEGRSTFSDSAEHYSYRADAVLVKPELSAITAPDSIKTFSDPLRGWARRARPGTRRTSESVRHRRREGLLQSHFIRLWDMIAVFTFVA